MRIVVQELPPSQARVLELSNSLPGRIATPQDEVKAWTGPAQPGETTISKPLEG